MFNNTKVTQSLYQQHVGIILGSRLKFKIHLKMVTTKIDKTIKLLRRLQNQLPRAALITIYKPFINPTLTMVISFVIKLLTGSFPKS